MRRHELGAMDMRGRAWRKKSPLTLLWQGVVHIVSIAFHGLFGRALTRPTATLSRRERGRQKPLSPWERGWGEGKSADQLPGNAICITRLAKGGR